jgi:hypothetical protein
MGKIKEWFSGHENTTIFISILLIYIISTAIPNIIGKTYEKYHTNKHSYEYAIREFERVCGKGHLWENRGYESEYLKFYDNKDEAINDFMSLATMYNTIYANGKFRHWYIWSKERVYRCCDRNKNRIALRYLKHKREGVNWKPTYEISFYVEKE